MIEVADFLSLSVAAPSTQSRFIGIYFRCETLADKMGGGTKAPPYDSLR